MRFTIRFENIDKPLIIDEFVQKKIVKLEKFGNLGEELKINISRNKELEFEVNVALDVIHQHVGVVAHAKNSDLYECIDECIDKLVIQALKIKEKKSEH